MMEKQPRRVRVRAQAPRVPSGHTTISVQNAIVLARAVLDSVPAPLPPHLRRALSELVYRCAVVPEAYENPEWLALRDQVLAPGADDLLDVFGKVLPQVAALADVDPNPGTDQALAELGDLVEHVLAKAQGEPIPPAMQTLYIEAVLAILNRVRNR